MGLYMLITFHPKTNLYLLLLVNGVINFLKLL